MYPYLYYGVWGSTYESNLARLIVLQKRVIRIITKSSFDAHTAPIFYYFNLLNLSNIYKLQAGIFMFSVHNKVLAAMFQSMFHQNSHVHSYLTRQANHYKIPYCRTNIMKFSIAYQGPKFWNSLPPTLKANSSLKTFKAKLKRHLITL